MVKKLLVTILAVAGTLVVGGVLLLMFREPLVKIAANIALTGTGVSLNRFAGLELGTRNAALLTLELGLEDGSLLTLSGIALSFEPSIPPVARTLTIASAEMTAPLPPEEAAPPPVPQPGDTADEPAVETRPDTLLLSDILRLLRDFPLDTFTLTELRIPQWPETLDLSLNHAAGELALDVDAGALQLNAGFAQDAPDAPARVRGRLTRGDAALGNLQLALQPATDSYVLSGTGHLAFNDLSALLGDLQRIADTDMPVQGASLDWELEGTVADDLRGTLAGTEPTTFSVSLQQDSYLTLPDDEVADLRQFEVRVTAPGELRVTTGADMAVGGNLPLRITGTWRGDPILANAVLNLNECQLESLVPCRFRFEGDAAVGEYGLSGTLALQLPGLALGTGAYRLTTTDLVLAGTPAMVPPFDIDANVTLGPDKVNFATPLLLRDAPGDARIELTGTYDLASGITSATAVLPEITFSETAPLSAWLGQWPYDGDVLAGSLELNLEGAWLPAQTPEGSGRLTADVTGSLNSLGGVYDTLFFGGLDTELTADINTGAEYILTTPPLTLTLATLDVGLPLQNLRLDLQMDGNTGQLRIAELSAEVLGGSISTRDVLYDLSRERNEFTIGFDELQLQRMLALAEYDAVTASGNISGTLPVTVTDGQVVVAGGTLAAQAPGGTISYRDAAAAGLQGNAGLDLANQVLGNFQYDRLTSSIDYTPEGELQLGMQLHGHNPELGSDQPINLNLNLTDDIPALLESLRAARDIEAFLEEQYAQ